MATTTTNPLDALVAARDGFTNARWNFPLAEGTPSSAPAGIGEAVHITYSFPVTDAVTYNSGPTTRFTLAMREAAREVLDQVAEVANVTFEQVSGVGQVTFRQIPQGSAMGGAFLPWFSYGGTGIVDNVREDEVSGDVWMDVAQAWTASDLLPGGLAHFALLRNIGTAMGLKVQSSAQSATMFLAPSVDDQAHTVMSTVAAGDALPSTLMLFDIEALQYLYGANRTTRAGNDEYRWDTNARVLETLWDGAGIDTIDCGNQVLRCVIRLEEGAYSLIGAEGRFAIAKGVTIEHATGGSGSDRLIGNGAANRLAGNAGNDALDGSGGNDILSGQSGNDVLVGGAGRDQLAGGAGGDVFDFDAAVHSGRTTATRDVISDFSRGEDRIDLSGIDANAATAANDSFHFIGRSAFSANATGQLRLEGDILHGSTDADAAAEFTVRLTGVVSLDANDFVL